MRSRFIATLCLAAVTIPVIAQQPMQVPGAKDATRVKAGSYTLDSAHSQVFWRVNHLGFNDYFGLFGSPTGTLTLDPAKPAAASVSIDLPIAMVGTSNEKLTGHLLGADFFDAAKFPTATFKSTSVAATGDKAKVTGDLTIKGVTKSVVLDVEFSGAGAGPPQAGGKDTVGFHASTTIKRSDFGIKYGIPFVPDEVPLQISAAFERQ